MNKLSTASTVLTFASAVGVVATSIFVAKAAPKASILLEKAEKEKGDKLTNIEKVRTSIPVYIPSIVVGASTVVCIFGANILNKRYQASLTSAYALLDSAFREYRSKENELYGDDADLKINTEMAKDRYEDDAELSEEEELFYDCSTHQYFVSTIDQVLQKTSLEDGMECYLISTPFDTLPMSCW